MSAAKIAYESKWGVYNPFSREISDDTIARTRGLAIRRAVSSNFSTSKLSDSQKWKQCYRRGFRLVKLNLNYVV